MHLLPLISRDAFSFLISLFGFLLLSLFVGAVAGAAFLHDFSLLVAGCGLMAARRKVGANVQGNVLNFLWQVITTKSSH